MIGQEEKQKGETYRLRPAILGGEEAGGQSEGGGRRRMGANSELRFVLKQSLPSPACVVSHAIRHSVDEAVKRIMHYHGA